MLQPYIPILLLIVFVVANAILMLGVSHIFSTYRRTPTKIAPYESGMPVLGDALEEAGCDGTEVLAHCRGGGDHARGCWVVDLALGRE